MFFAAKEAVERQAVRRGQKEERDRIRRALGERRETITMEELSRILDGELSATQALIPTDIALGLANVLAGTSDVKAVRGSFAVAGWWASLIQSSINQHGINSEQVGTMVMGIATAARSRRKGEGQEAMFTRAIQMVDYSVITMSSIHLTDPSKDPLWALEFWRASASNSIMPFQGNTTHLSQRRMWGEPEQRGGFVQTPFHSIIFDLCGNTDNELSIIAKSFEIAMGNI